MYVSGSPFTPRGDAVPTPATTPGLTPKRRIVRDICPYCSEPLSNVIENEPIAELQCGDAIHVNCLLLLTTQPGVEDDEVTCPGCSAPTKPITDLTNFRDNLHNIEAVAFKPVEPTPTQVALRELLASLEPVGSGDGSEAAEGGVDAGAISTPSPVTPKEQMGAQFWQNAHDLHPIPKPRVLDMGTNAVDVARVEITPQYWSIDEAQLAEDNGEVYCAVQITTTKFETITDAWNNERLKMQIVGSLIYSWDFKVDVADLNRGLLFDYFDEVEVAGRVLHWCQVFLFETALVLIHNGELVLNQFLDKGATFVSSIFTNGEDVVINLNNLKTPDVRLSTTNKMMRVKWANVLRRFAKDDNQMTIFDEIPLIQLSTNAWPLVDNKYIPEDVEILSKLLAKGLDLPSGFLQRQLIKPEPIPLKLVMVVPLYNPADGQWTNEEYARLTQKLLRSTLESLNVCDRFGVVFVQNERHDIMGSYYGCASKAWDGWDVLVESISEEVVTSVPSEISQWKEGLEMVQLLCNVCFNEEEYVNEVVFVSTELCTDVSVGRVKGSTPFGTAKVEESLSVCDFVKELSDTYNVQFSAVLVTDEYAYDVEEIWHHFDALRACCGEKALVVDYDDLSELVDKFVDTFHDVVVRDLRIDLEVAEGVQLHSSEIANPTHLHLRNLKSGYLKSFLVKLEVDGAQFKGLLMRAQVNMDEGVKFEASARMKVVSEEVYLDRLEVVGAKSKMRIVPQLSNTPNGVFVKRQIERVVMERIMQNVVDVARFDGEAKRMAQADFRALGNDIWELFKQCTTSGIDHRILEQWVEGLIDEIESLNEGFNLRNVELARLRWMIMYLRFI